MEVTVLVTRPAAQAEELCARIEKLGGTAIKFPTITIEATPCTACEQIPDWLVFISANAVRFGQAQAPRAAHTRIAAIGNATARALESLDIRVDAQPEKGSSSEALLAHPAFANVAQQSVIIVKGAGGRELLHDALVQRGARVTALEVYRRALPQVDAAAVAQLETRWRDDGISLVTLTSVETLDNLVALLSAAGRALLRTTPFVTLSERIAAAAHSQGIVGTCVLSRGADDDAIIGAIAAWHARAR